MPHIPDKPAQTENQEYQLSLIDISYKGVPKQEREKLQRMALRKEKRIVRHKQIRRKVLKGSAASVLGLSITIAGLFPSSSNLLRQQTIRQLENAAPVEMMLEEELTEEEEEEKKKAQTGSTGGSLWERLGRFLRNAILKLPMAVRACVGVPLWACGSLMLHLLAGLYQTVLSPVISHVISFILLAAVLVGIFALTMKSIFPDMPLRKILRWKNIRWVLLGAAFVKLIDLLLPVFWGEYTRYKYVILLAAGCIVLGLNIIPKIRRYKKKHSVQRDGFGMPETS